MSHCRACNKPVQFKYRRDSDQELMADSAGAALVEDLCEECIEASTDNPYEDVLWGLWLNREGHESHVRVRPRCDYIN